MKYLLIPFIMVGCTAPVTDPPAHADIMQDYQTLMTWARKNVEYERNKVKTEGIEDEYKALMEFNHGSDDTTKQEVLLQLPSDQH